MRGILAFALPVYILAYIDESEYLKSSMTQLIVIVVLALICYLMARKLGKDYLKMLKVE